MKDASNLTESDAYRIVIRDLLWLLDHSEKRRRSNFTPLVPCGCEVCERLRLSYSISTEKPYDSFLYSTLLPSEPPL